MDRSRVALLIPALNEARTIGTVVERLRPQGVVIVVDDGSTDDTSEIARTYGADVVPHASNLGYDAALESAFARASALGCEFVITVDADGQHPTDLIPSFLAAFESGADLVLGSRDRIPRLSEKVFRVLARSLYDIEDPVCGMKGYRMALYRACGHFDSYRSIGTELMLHAVRNGATVRHIPVQTRRRVGRARIGNMLSANYLILRAALLGLVRHATRPLEPHHP